MATTYVAPKAATGVQVRAHIHTDTVYSAFDIEAAVATAANGGGGAGAAAFVINDVVQMIKMDAGPIITHMLLTVPSLDSSTGIVTAVGDGSDDDRFFAGATIGRSSAEGAYDTLRNGGHLYTYTSADTIDFKVTTAATGTAAVAGVIKLSVRTTTQQ